MQKCLPSQVKAARNKVDEGADHQKNQAQFRPVAFIRNQAHKASDPKQSGNNHRKILLNHAIPRFRLPLRVMRV